MTERGRQGQKREKHTIDFIVKSLKAAMKAKDFKHLVVRFDEKHQEKFRALVQKYAPFSFGLEKSGANKFELFINRNIVSKFMKEASELIPAILIELYSANMIFEGETR